MFKICKKKLFYLIENNPNHRHICQSINFDSRKKTCECLEILALTIYYYIYKLDA